MPRKNVRDRISWTSEMNSDLLSCKKDAIAAVNSENPPKKPNGRKMGYIELMYKLWIEKGNGYESFNLTSQNLSDQARKLECKQTNLLSPISETVDNERNVIIEQNLAVNNSNLVNIENTVMPVNDVNILDVEKVNRLIKEADAIYNVISINKGDCGMRTFSTRLRSTPKDEDIKYIDNGCVQLIHQKDLNNIQDMDMLLWCINCVVYSVIVAWIKINDIKGMECVNKSTSNNKLTTTSPKWLQVLETSIKEIRARLSKCCAELNRLKTNGRLTRRTKRNREEIKKECGEITHYSLVCYMEKLKKRVKYLAKKRKRKLRNEKARKLNNEFQRNPKSVFEKFRNCISEDPENLKPVYKERFVEKRYFEDPVPVERFWRTLWEKQDQGNPDAEWLKEITEKISEIVPDVYDGELVVSRDVCFNYIRKKKNWSSPGPDKITNFWWKKLTSIIIYIVKIFHNFINVVLDIASWVCTGRVALLPKPGDWAEDNQRPITCLNTVYKWFTSILLYFHNSHLNKYNLLQIDQRGAMKDASGTVNNLLIDDLVMRDAKMHRRNIFCYWVDVRKAFDSVSHSWLIKMLEIHRFPKKLIQIFQAVIKRWSVRILIPVKEGYMESNSISLTNGILQGDSYCPGLYILTMNIVSWILRSFEGYKLSKPILKKITHTLYVDDLKGYANTRQKLEYILNILQSCMEDAGLIWNQKKTKFIEMKRGQFRYANDITLSSGITIKCLKEDENYEFMGVPQQTKMNDEELGNELLKIVKQRSHLIWSSDLSDANKCMASNQIVNGAVDYYFWAVKFPLNVVREMDVAIRDSMNVTGSKHTNLMNAINYLPRKEGGRGLRSLEETYKTTKVKLAVKLANEQDHRIKIVKEFHMITRQTNSFSIFKDAERYAAEMGVKIDLNDDLINLAEIETDEVFPEKSLTKRLRLKTSQQRKNEILKSTWQGVNTKQRMDDENVLKGYFSWLERWRTCPTNVVHEFFLLFYQLLPTLKYKAYRSNEVVDDTRCRICRSGEETVKHLMSNCGELAKSLYKTRHDNALKCFVWPVLHLFKLVEKCPPWYSCDKVAPYYENECKSIRFWWDIPEYTGRDEESAKPPRPDGKLMLESETEKVIYLIEMSVPWTGNREEKFIHKAVKYNQILQTMKLENPTYKIDQITIIIDVFGGYGPDLIDNIGKVFKRKSDINSIVSNMQKSVVAASANLSRTFKIRTSGLQ